MTDKSFVAVGVEICPIWHAHTDWVDDDVRVRHPRA